MAYVPTDPTGPPPAHLVAMNIDQLVNTLRNDADALLVNHRMNVTADLIRANHEIKHIIRIIIDHAVQVEERAVQVEEREKQTKTELDTASGLLKYLQDVNNAREREIYNVRRRLTECQRMREMDRDTSRIANDNYTYDLQEQQTRQRRIRDGLQQRNNRLADQLAIERLTTRNLGRIRARMQTQLAALRIQAQWFRIRQPGPVVNNPPNTPQVIWLPLQ